MFDWWLFKKKEKKEEMSAILCNHANENPNVCNCVENCFCQTHTCKDRIGKPGVRTYPEPEEIFNCLMCGRNVEAGWKYIWKGKEGFMHRETCGRNFHVIGSYLLDRASKVLEEQGIKVVQTKEKFGMMMLYATPKNEIESKIIKTVQKNWQATYSEFDWYFR